MTSSDKAQLTTGRPRGPRTQSSGLRVAVVCSRFNDVITDRLLDGARATLAEHGVPDDAIVEVWVPGAFELPLAAKRLAESGETDAIVCLGAVIRGETGHYDLVAGQCAAGIQSAQLSTGVPIGFGVLATDTVEQAEERAGGAEGNKGSEAAEAALEMAALLGRLAKDGPA